VVWKLGAIETCEVFGFARISVCEAECVATSPMKGAFKVENFGAPFAITGGQVLANLPIHGGFQGVFHGQRAAFDEEVALQWAHTHDAVKRFNKVDVMCGVDVGIGYFYSCGFIECFFYLLLIKIGMIEANWERSVKAV